MTATILCCAYLIFPYPDDVETARYLRPAGKGYATECVFTLKQTKGGPRIESVTERGKTRLTVTADYDCKNRLMNAKALLRVGEETNAATVTVKNGKAKIERAGRPAQEFDVPAGVIVTSAPDWTDTFLLCRRYDRKAGGKQSFAGLWIHPVQPCQRLTFTIERHDAVAITHAGKKVTLDRYTIRLRGNSAYAAWADAAGKMIKLVPLPYKENAANWLVAEGFEASTAPLRP